MPLKKIRSVTFIPRRSVGTGASSVIQLPQYLLPTGLPDPIEDFENTTGWTATGVIALDNTPGEFFTGSNSLKLTAPLGSYGEFKKDYNPGSVSGTKQVRLFICPEGSNTELTGMRFTLAAATDYSKKLEANVSYVERLKWNGVGAVITWKASNFTPTGGQTWDDTIARVRYSYQNAAAMQHYASVDTLRIIKNSMAAIMLRFDDGYASQYNTVYPILSAHNICATLSIITSWPGIGGYVTWEQCIALNNAGWTIANHTNDTTVLSGQSLANQEAQIAGGRDDLIAQGLSRGANYLVFPNGQWDANTKTAMTNTGMLLGHTTIPHVNRTPVLPSWDITEVESTGIGSGTTVATAKGYVDDAITHGYILPMHFHDIGGAGEWTAAQLEEFVNYVASVSANITPITLNDYYRLTLGTVTVPKVKP